MAFEAVSVRLLPSSTEMKFWLMMSETEDLECMLYP